MDPRALKLFAKRLDKSLFPDAYADKDHYRRLLEREISEDCKTLLDLGCGSCSPIASLKDKLEYSVGVDIFAPAIQQCRKNQTHTENFVLPITQVRKHFKPKTFDCVVALESLEHLEKEDGRRLIKDMQLIAKKKVIIFTTNGFLEQGEMAGNVYQKHKSGWSAEEMRNMGFKVFGVNGFKALRKEHAEIAWQPKIFWERVSLASNPIVEKVPKWAFQILCVKES